MKLVVISKIVFTLLVLNPPRTFGARILGIVATPSFSHQVAFQSLWRELSLRGHEVTLITTHPIKDPSLKTLTEIDVSDVMRQMEEMQAKSANMNEMIDINIIEMTILMKIYGFFIIDAHMRNPDVQNLIQNKSEHFDVALVETIFPGTVAFADRFNCPLIQILSLDAPMHNYYLMGHPSHPILNPDFMLRSSGEGNFLERLSNVLYVPFGLYYYTQQIFPEQDQINKKYFGADISPIADIMKNTSLMFINTDNVFHKIRPLLPNVIQIGGGTHLKASKPLPKKLQIILDNAKNGAIYFSLGSNVKSSLLSQDIQKIFLETFAELPYTVLWKFELDDMAERPENLIVSKWFPQQDIFRHPNVKLFISQGGLQSMDEAVHNYIPIIGIPFAGDQDNNVKRMTDKGFGIGLNIRTINKTILKEAIFEVMNNARYRNKARELAELSRDQPMTGLDRAVWWTEYVIRHKGAKHLRSPAIDLPDYQYYLLDVIGFCLLIVFIIVYVLFKVVKLSFRIVTYFLPKTKIKVQ